MPEEPKPRPKPNEVREVSLRPQLWEIAALRAEQEGYPSVDEYIAGCIRIDSLGMNEPPKDLEEKIFRGEN